MGKNNGGKKRTPGSSWLYLVMFSILLLFVNIGSVDTVDRLLPERVPFRQFDEWLMNGDVDTVYIDMSSADIKFTLLTEETRQMTVDERNEIPLDMSKVIVTDYLNNSEDLTEHIVDCGAQLVYRSFDNSDSILAVLQLLLTVGINVGFLYLIYRLMKKQMNMGSGEKGRIVNEKVSDIYFKDIIGQDEVIQDIQHIIKIMKDKDKYSDMNVRLPKGVLLIGPPGTGKTMIAKALANEAGMKYFSVNSSALIDRFVGMGAKNVRETFQQAKKNTPCIIFFDEIDAIGSSREQAAGHSENRQTINALLQELDGFGSSENILVIGATNCYEDLDKALVRAGRFDRKIVIMPPRDAETRLKLLEHYLGDSVAEEVNLLGVAKQLAGFTGADIDQVTNEAKLICIQKDIPKVTQDVLDEAIEKALFNGNRTKNKYENDLQVVAHHECGHALSLLINNMPVARISIVPNTSGVGGMVIQSDGDTLFTKKKDIRARIKSMYSGRIAEELIYGMENITSGASSDLKQANKAISNYLNDFAFDDAYGLVPLDEKSSAKKRSELARELYDEAKKELANNIDILRGMAKIVLEEETMDGDALKEVYERLLRERDEKKQQ